MDFITLVKNRHSIRKYIDKDIESELLNSVIQPSQYAPSAGNLKAYEIIVVKDKVKINKIAEASGKQMFIAEAPVVMVFCTNENNRLKYGIRGYFYAIQDATIAAAYIQLAAVEKGLGTCWIGAFDPHEVKKSLDISDSELFPIIVMPIGFGYDEVSG